MALLPGDHAPYVFESPLPASAAGSTLLDYLSGRFAYQSRETWRMRILEGDVRLDGIANRVPDSVLPGRGSLAYVHGTFEEPQVPTDWTYLHCAEDWLTVSKPAGMPVHSTTRIFRQSLVWQVRRLSGSEWSPVHRLDRDTSGLVLFARGDALAALARHFSERRVEKRYLALVRGRPEGAFTVEMPLGPAGDPRIPMRQGVRSDGKECRTEFLVLGPDSSGRGTWLEVFPRQGRLHQIRAHLEHAGFPILGDLLYDGRGGEGFLARAAGAPAEQVADLVGASRMWLHAASLRFPSGTRNLPDLLECSLPGVSELV